MSSDKNIKDIYSLAPLQEGILFHWLLDESSSTYFDQMEYTLIGKIDVGLLENSVNKITERYDILRTIFIYEKVKAPIQVVLKERTTKIYYEDISHLGGEEQKNEYIKKFRKRDRERGCDLSKDLLMRIALFQWGENQVRLIWSFHHILMDAWCLEILYKELVHIYASLKKGEPLQLEPVIPYKNYIQWLELQDKEEGLRYWQEYLYGYESPAVVPGFNNNRSNKKSESVRYFYNIDPLLSDGLLNMAGENNVTANTVFQTLWGILLQKYNNVEDVVYGAVASGRPADLSGIEKMVGFFINTIPVRITLGKDRSFLQLLRRVQQREILSKSYEYFPLAEVQSCSPLKKDLINHVMVFESRPVMIDRQEKSKSHTIKENTRNPRSFDLTLVNEESSHQINYDFALVITPQNPFVLALYFEPSAYEGDFIHNIAMHIIEAIKQVVKNPGIDARNIEILSKEDKKKLLVDFNQTDTAYPKDKTIHELFVKQVEKTPDNIAAAGEGTTGPWQRFIQLTYRELNKKANRLAYLLKKRGATLDVVAGIMVRHSIEMIVGILGILKAGGAFLPIDPGYPQKRVLSMLNDSCAPILLATANVLDRGDSLFTALQGPQLQLPRSEIRVTPRRPQVRFGRDIVIMDEGTEILNDGPHQDLEIVNRSNDLSYVIFTSGSSGTPKGVLVEHGALVNLCFWHNRCYKVTERDHASKYAGFGFDASIWEIFPYLIAGASLYIIDDAIKLDMQALNRCFETHDITIGFLPTQICEQFMSLNRENRSLRILLTGGDKLNIFHKKNYELYNNYGPTENTVVASSYLVDGYRENIPIGKPIGNSKIYILAKNRKHLQPTGMPGELCIGGDSLARGYLNDAELAKEKFRDDLAWNGQRLYFTGDLARWLPDGNIEFLGRIDQQVKIRGVRIEPGEIQYQLNTHPKVKGAWVMTGEGDNGESELCAFVVCEKALELSELKEYLVGKLPDYMIPSYFLQIDKIPLTLNGKVDRNALFEKGKRFRSSNEFIAPRFEIERRIAEVWRQVLKVDREEIGIYDNFFDLGGDSIKVIRMRSRLKEITGKDIRVTDLFEYPTIDTLARFLKQEEGNEKIDEAIDRSARINNGKTSLQQRLKQRKKN